MCPGRGIRDLRFVIEEFGPDQRITVLNCVQDMCFRMSLQSSSVRFLQRVEEGQILSGMGVARGLVARDREPPYSITVLRLFINPSMVCSELKLELLITVSPELT
jgi:hypothetical protein